MNKKLLVTTTVVSSVVLLLGSMTIAGAETYSGGDANYEYVEKDGGIVIIRAETTSSDVSIPDEINGKSVVGLGEGAFSETSVTSVSMPDTVTFIDTNCFADCSRLDSIDLSESLTEIGDSSFANCTALENIDIPSGVTDIKNGAFSNCSSLKKVSIPDSVNNIESNAFSWTTSLESVDWDMTAENVSGDAFYESQWLEIYPDEFILLNNGTFLYRYTGNGSEVEIPSTVTAINEDAFENSNIESIDLPDFMDVIPASLFYSCKTLKDVSIPNGVTGINDSAFAECTSLELIELPDSLEYIAQTAFSGSGLTEIVIPENVRSIGEYCFSECSSLKKVKLPSELTSLGEAAFQYCDNLTEINIPAGICSTIPRDTFRGVDALTDVTIEGKLTTELGDALSRGNWAGGGSDEEFVLIDDILYMYNGDGGDVVIPNGIKEIGRNAFAGKEITSVTFPEGLTRIGDMAFYGVNGLTSISIPGSVTSIGQMAFSNCSNLKDITFEPGEQTLTLGRSSFQLTAATEETIKMDGRSVLHVENAFINTTLDPDFAPATEAPSETEQPSETPSAVPEEKGTLSVISTGDDISIEVNEQIVTFPDAKPFIDENGRTQVPIRAAAELLGCEVEWDGSTGTVMITDGDEIITLVIGRTQMQKGQQITEMDTAPVIINDRTYIPVRFVGEALGLEVNWNE